MRIVDKLGIGAVPGLSAKVQDARSDGTKMQECRCSARATVEGEGDRPVGRSIFGDIGGVEYRPGLGAILTEDIECSGRRRIGQSAAADISLMLSDGIRRQQSSTPGRSWALEAAGMATVSRANRIADRRYTLLLPAIERDRR